MSYWAKAQEIGFSGLIVQLGLFDVHVFEFTGLEDVPTLQAFDEFRIFMAGDDLYARVLTLIHLTSLLGGLRRRDWSHKTGMLTLGGV